MACDPQLWRYIETGILPRSVRRNFGSWFAFLDSIGLLSPEEKQARGLYTRFFEDLETTPMTRSFKMVTLLAMLNEDQFPGGLRISELTASVRRLGHSRPNVAEDFGESFASDELLRQSLVSNPIEAWVGGAGTGGNRYFSFEQDTFRTAFNAPEALRPALQSLTRELTEWRLAEYFDRTEVPTAGTHIIKVNQSNGTPILMPLNREKNPSLPEGWTPFRANGQSYLGNFAKIARLT